MNIPDLNEILAKCNIAIQFEGEPTAKQLESIRALDKIAFAAKLYADREHASPIIRELYGDWKLSGDTSFFAHVIFLHIKVLLQGARLSERELARCFHNIYNEILDLQSVFTPMDTLFPKNQKYKEKTDEYKLNEESSILKTENIELIQSKPNDNSPMVELIQSKPDDTIVELIEEFPISEQST